MPFAVEFAPRAARQARKLAPDVQRRIRHRLLEVAANPAGMVQRLTGVGAYKVRAGDHRIIVDADWDEGVVYVLWVGHRRVAS